MKKRIVCMILSLVLLMGLVPAGVITASAAAKSTSKDAIKILKQVEGYDDVCDARGYTGYGTKCTKSGAHGTGAHKIDETIASNELGTYVKTLDKAVNNFASKHGLNLTQNQHDALVLFSFQNGTAWTEGTGDFQRAIVKGTKGNEFLNVICNWSSSDSNQRRLIEANMYLNNAYVSSVPSSYIFVQYELQGGKLATSKTAFYYDTNLAETKLPVPTKTNAIFRGWFNGNDWITGLDKSCNGMTLTAWWQGKDAKPADAAAVSYGLKANQLCSAYVYKKVGGDVQRDYVEGDLWFSKEFIDANGVKWGRLSSASNYYSYDTNKHTYKKGNTNYNFTSNERWVIIGTALANGSNSGVSVGGGSGSYSLVKCQVTNSYVRRRAEANIFSQQTGQYYEGDYLYIEGAPIERNGYRWGYVVSGDGVFQGYVALNYTNYDEAKRQQSSSNNAAQGIVEPVVAKALVKVNGYVNVRDGAGTSNNIVGALRNGTEVDLYQTQYVNGQQWGRCSTGWFCLSYAEVNRLVEDKPNADLGFTSYVFQGTLVEADYIYDAPGGNPVTGHQRKDGDVVTVGNITARSDGSTWGKIPEGWVRLTKWDGSKYVASNVILNVAKFTVTADTATVREEPKNGATRVDVLSNNVEFDVTLIVADDTTIWGFANKVGEGNKTYDGWVNLSGKYVSRYGAKVETEAPSSTYLVAKVINTPTVNVRQKPSIFAAKSGTLANGTIAKVLSGPENGVWYLLDIDADNNENTPSWVSSAYLDVYKGTVTSNSTPTSPDGDKAATGKGVIANTYGGVNVRTAPGTANAKVGKILPNTVVEILEVKYHGTTLWGRVEQGWICMDYVAMIDYDDIPVGNTGSGSNSTVTTTESAIYTGTVNMDVNVRKETSLESDVIRVLKAGDPVTVHEIVKVEEVVQNSDNNTAATTTKTITYWARVNDGYIKAPGDHITLDNLDDTIYTVTGTEELKVRDNPGTEGTNVIDKLEKGDQVTVTKVKIVNGGFWGYVEMNATDENGNILEGWVSLAYMSKGEIAVETTPPAGSETTPPAQSDPVVQSIGNTGVCNYSGVIVGTNEVRVRKEATTNSAEVTTLKKGTAITITETRLYDGRSWGFCGSGWVNLVYVDLTPVGSTAIDVKVIDRDNAMIYRDSTGSDPAGTYARRAVVNIYEEVNGRYRTDLGWVDKGAFL